MTHAGLKRRPVPVSLAVPRRERNEMHPRQAEGICLVICPGYIAILGVQCREVQMVNLILQAVVPSRDVRPPEDQHTSAAQPNSRCPRLSRRATAFVCGGGGRRCMGPHLRGSQMPTVRSAPAAPMTCLPASETCTSYSRPVLAVRLNSATRAP